MSVQKPKKYITDYSYNNQSIPISIWVNGPFSKINTILYLGTVQVARLPKIIASRCPNGVAIVQGAPHWFADKSGNTIPDFMFNFSLDIYKFIISQIPIGTELNIIAESQAAPGALKLAAHHLIKKIVILQPLGLNGKFFGNTMSDRFDELKNRTRKNIRHQIPNILTDFGLLYNHIVLFSIGIRESMLGRAANHYAAGLAHCSLSDLAKVQEKVTIITGENDEIFPYKEITKNLNDNNITKVKMIQIANIPHSPLSGKAGKLMLKRAFDELI